MNRRIQDCLGVPATVALGLCLVLLPGLGRAQSVVTVENFKVPEYYPKPHETQMKSMLEGVRAQRQPDGHIDVEQAKYRTFNLTSNAEMLVEAPQCTYDPGPRTISSPGPLRVQTADGKFSIEGVGFLFRQTNSTLYVSNQVHTVVHPELLNPAPGTAAVTHAEAPLGSGIEVFSDEFEYGKDTGLGVYQGHVRVAGTNLSSTAGKMTILLPVTERRLKTLTAEENVVVDYESLHATGAKAVYSDDTGLVRMTGQPTWRVQQREGRGDELVLDVTNRIFSAIGNAKMKLPAQSMGESGFLSRAGAASRHPAAAAEEFVEILCSDYEIRTNKAVFRQDVRVSDRAGNDLKGQMTCQLMTLLFAGTNELQTMVAERRVVIRQADNQFTAGRAEYAGTNGVLDLTEDPAWRAGSREGSGDLLRVNLAQKEMLVKGNAVMKLPAAELGQTAFTKLEKAGRAEAAAGTNEFAVVHSAEYFVTPASALFRGGVQVEHPQMKWACQEITLLSPPELGKDGRVMIAEPGVVFQFTDGQGRTFHGTGDKAVYTHRITTTRTNDVMELTGRPAMLQTTNLVGGNNLVMIGRNHLITLDLASQKMTAPGRYKLWGTLPPGTTTSLRSPKTGFP